MNNKTKTKGFTLIELLVVIAIIGLLSTLAAVSLNFAKARARDGKRLSDMHQMQIALELYYDSFGRFPDSDFAGCGGWDSSGNGTFITPLVANHFLPAHLLDPAINDSCGNYAYYRYGAGTYSCYSSSAAFYVLGVRDMETSGNPYPASPGWSCSGRNWQGEFDYVVGKLE
ncbi:MAG: type II secretion system protein [Candidatus Komeilibacteria bacterium]|nr:type II secretion system protein [Candidatus Komeilibacteria bacterium]